MSPSHTLEYKPNNIIITSSIGDVLLHHPKYLYVILTSLGSTSKDLGGGASVLILTLALLRLLTAPAPRTHHVTVSRPWRQPGAAYRPSERSSAHSLSHCVIARDPEKRDRSGSVRDQKTDAYGLQRADVARVLSVALSASSLAEPVPTPENQTMPVSASLRSFAEQRYLTFRSSARPRSIKNRVATVSSQDYM